MVRWLFIGRCDWVWHCVFLTFSYVVLATMPPIERDTRWNYCRGCSAYLGMALKYYDRCAASAVAFVHVLDLRLGYNMFVKVDSVPLD